MQLDAADARAGDALQLPPDIRIVRVHAAKRIDAAAFRLIVQRDGGVVHMRHLPRMGGHRQHDGSRYAGFRHAVFKARYRAVGEGPGMGRRLQFADGRGGDGFGKDMGVKIDDLHFFSSARASRWRTVTNWS